MTPEAMAALHATCFTTPRPWTPAEFAGFLADPLCFAVQAPAGVLIGRAVAGEAELLTLAVAPAARRAGLGRHLVEGFLTEARARHADSAFLEVSAENAAAIALYTATGFAVAGRRKGYYQHPDGQRADALLMAQALSATSP